MSAAAQSGFYSRCLLLGAGERGGSNTGQPPPPAVPREKGPELETRSREPFYCGLIHFILTIPHNIKTL